MLPQILVLLAAIGGTTLLLGGGGWLWYRIERLESRGATRPAGDGEPTGEVDDLREQLALTQEEVRRLDERLDFLERLLEEGATTEEGRRLAGEEHRGPD